MSLRNPSSSSSSSSCCLINSDKECLYLQAGLHKQPSRELGKMRRSPTKFACQKGFRWLQLISYNVRERTTQETPQKKKKKLKCVVKCEGASSARIITAKSEIWSVDCYTNASKARWIWEKKGLPNSKPSDKYLTYFILCNNPDVVRQIMQHRNTERSPGWGRPLSLAAQKNILVQPQNNYRTQSST